jgi:hypothetical protein
MSTEHRHSRICIEKIPHVHKQKMQQAKQAGHSPEHMERLQAAFLKDNIWPPGSILRIAFIDGESNSNIKSSHSMNWSHLSTLKQDSGTQLDPLEEKLRDMNLTSQEVVKKVINERIVPLVGLRIEFVDNPSQANIRVAFDPNDGAWAYVGTDHLEHPDIDEATVNFGWLDVGTIIHEFCHVLGMIHEHQNPRGKQIEWDDDAVYEYMKNTQGWDKEITDTNVLDRYKISQLNGSDFDPLSVMLYFFSSELTENNQGTKQNMRFSGVDVKWISDMYSKNAQETAVEFYPRVYNISLEKAIGKSDKARDRFSEGKSKLPGNLLLILGIMLSILITGVIIWHFAKRKVL